MAAVMGTVCLLGAFLTTLWNAQVRTDLAVFSGVVGRSCPTALRVRDYSPRVLMLTWPTFRPAWTRTLRFVTCADHMAPQTRWLEQKRF